MNSEIPRVSQLEGVKMMAYQYIQQSRVKLMNRVSYLLMEHIVEQYQMNEYFRFTMAGSVSTAKQMISDAIELFMQQKIQSKQAKAVVSGESMNKNDQNVDKCEEKIQIADLVQRNRDLSQQNQNLRSTCEKERRKINKLLQRYNCLSQVMFEVKEKYQQQIKDITNHYELKLQETCNRNIQLREHIARLDVTIQLITQTGNHFNPILAKIRTQNTMSFANQEEKAVLSDFNFRIHQVLDLNISPKRRDLCLMTSQCQYMHQPQIKPSGKNKLSLNKVDLHLIKPTVKLSRQVQTDRQQVQIPCKFCDELKIKDQQQTSLNLDDVETKNIEVCTQTLQGQSEQLIACREELNILSHLCQAYQKRTNTYKNNLTVLLSQKMELITLSNKIFEETEQKTKQFLQEIAQQQLKNSELCNKIQQVKQQKIDLLNLIQQYQVHTSHSLPAYEQIKTAENLYAQSDQTDESSNQPRKDLHIYFQLNANEAHHQKVTNPNQIIEGYILKQTISRYFLQLMDCNCRGQKKLVLLNQIGECLGWEADQYERLQFYRQRTRLKSEIPTVEQPQSSDKVNFKDRFYRFLTNESQAEE